VRGQHVDLVEVGVAVHQLNEREADRGAVVGDRDPEQALLLGVPEVGEPGHVGEDARLDVEPREERRGLALDLGEDGEVARLRGADDVDPAHARSSSPKAMLA
jgi:hypothetical protein